MPFQSGLKSKAGQKSYLYIYKKTFIKYVSFLFSYTIIQKIYHKSDIFKTIHNLIQTSCRDWFPEKFPQGKIFILVMPSYRITKHQD